MPDQGGHGILIRRAFTRGGTLAYGSDLPLLTQAYKQLNQMSAGFFSPSYWLRRVFLYRPGRLARGTLSVSSGMFIQGVLQAAILVVLARALGVTEYGGFVAAAAFITLLVPLAGMGCGFLLVRDSARDHQLFPEAFGRSLIILAMTALPLIVLALAIGHFILPSQVSTAAILALAISELIFAPASELVARAYQAFELTGRMAFFRAALFAVRLIVLAFLWLTTRITTTSAAIAYAGSSIIVAIIALALVARELGVPEFRLNGILEGMEDGFHFSVNYTAFRMNSDIDKVMLAKLASPATAGFVGAAFRLMQGVMLPIRALLEAGYARFFNAGAQGTTATINLARKWLPLPLAYSVLTGVGIFIFAGLAPVLLGQDFGSSVLVLRWFAPYPVVALLHYGLDTMLTTSNRQRFTARVMMAGAVINVGLNFWLIPILSWKGAVLSAYCSELVIVTAYLGALLLSSGTRPMIAD